MAYDEGYVPKCKKNKNKREYQNVKNLKAEVPKCKKIRLCGNVRKILAPREKFCNFLLSLQNRKGPQPIFRWNFIDWLKQVYDASNNVPWTFFSKSVIWSGSVVWVEDLIKLVQFLLKAFLMLFQPRKCSVKDSHYLFEINT